MSYLERQIAERDAIIHDLLLEKGDRIRATERQCCIGVVQRLRERFCDQNEVTAVFVCDCILLSLKEAGSMLPPDQVRSDYQRLLAAVRTAVECLTLAATIYAGDTDDQAACVEMYKGISQALQVLKREGV